MSRSIVFVARDQLLRLLSSCRCSSSTRPTPTSSLTTWNRSCSLSDSTNSRTRSCCRYVARVSDLESAACGSGANFASGHRTSSKCASAAVPLNSSAPVCTVRCSLWSKRRTIRTSDSVAAEQDEFNSCLARRRVHADKVGSLAPYTLDRTRKAPEERVEQRRLARPVDARDDHGLGVQVERLCARKAAEAGYLDGLEPHDCCPRSSCSRSTIEVLSMNAATSSSTISRDTSSSATRSGSTSSNPARAADGGCKSNGSRGNSATRTSCNVSSSSPVDTNFRTRLVSYLKSDDGGAIICGDRACGEQREVSLPGLRFGPREMLRDEVDELTLC